MTPKAKVIAFTNQKGGVAKTTTTLNLAAAFVEEGHRVLCVDMDPQGNLTMSQGIDPDSLERSMYDVLVHHIPIKQVVRRREIDVACASIDLAGAEIAMSTSGLRFSRIIERVFCSWISPRIDRYSHCTGTITLFAAVSALIVSSPRLGGLALGGPLFGLPEELGQRPLPHARALTGCHEREPPSRGRDRTGRPCRPGRT